MLEVHAYRFVAALVLVATVPLSAQAPSRIKLATQAPENSPWHAAIADMGAGWAKATGGRVQMQVIPGGSIGSESSVIAMMDPELGTLQAATLMVAGLSEIDDAFNAFGMPFFFQSDEEFAYVRAQLTPFLSQRLEKKGFRLLNWGNGGWVQIFSKRPLKTVDDLKQAKLYTTEGDDRTVRWYNANGFHAVPLAMGEISKQLKLPVGQINAAPSPPYFALAIGFYKDATYMLDLRVAPLPGATIITDKAWSKIALNDRAKMQELALAMETQVQAKAPALDASSIRSMQEATKNAKSPFQVMTLDAAATAAFRAEGERLALTQRGSLVPADVFDLAVKARDAFRKMNTQGK